MKVKAQHKNLQKAAGKFVHLHLILTNAEGSAAKTKGNLGEGDHKTIQWQNFRERSKNIKLETMDNEELFPQKENNDN